MVDKETKRKPKGSAMGEHNNATADRIAGLEKKLDEFIIQLDQVTVEIADIKSQQQDLINLIRMQYKK
jgi:hypothetical protein